MSTIFCGFLNIKPWRGHLRKPIKSWHWFQWVSLSLRLSCFSLQDSRGHFFRAVFFTSHTTDSAKEERPVVYSVTLHTSFCTVSSSPVFAALNSNRWHCRVVPGNIWYRNLRRILKISVSWLMKYVLGARRRKPEIRTKQLFNIPGSGL